MQMRLFIPREHARVDDLNASLEAVLANNGVSPAIQGDVRLIVEELASNAIEHGDLARVEAEEHELCVDIAIREHLLTLEFRESGAPFNPLEQPPPDLDADILDPFITLHSPAAPQEKPAEPFRAAASETQLDVEPDFGETKVQAGQNHMAAWDPQPAVPVKEPEKPAAPVQPAREEPEAAAEEPVEPEQMNFAPADGPEPLRYVGEVFRTYILAERGDELCLIDKHAAHERQLYEKLAANYGNVPSQMLLEPTAIDLSAEEKQALLDHVPLLENAGLEIADFGGNTVVLRAVPADVEPQNAESLLIEIANKLLKGGHDALNEHTEWVLHSISCRAAIKAGDKSSPQELLALAEKILSGEVPPFCPHGRPCVLKLTRKELEKQFGRIV